MLVPNPALIRERIALSSTDKTLSIYNRAYDILSAYLFRPALTVGLALVKVCRSFTVPVLSGVWT